jgi:hypothetical protein
MTTRITIPRTVTGITKRLGELGKLATATEWERAALVASIVRVVGRGGDRRSGEFKRSIAFETPDQFAARHIHGLTSANTVRLYANRWFDAMGDYPEPGAKIDLPDLEWPPQDENLGSRISADPATAIAQIVAKHGDEAVSKAVASQPSLARAVTREPAIQRAVIDATIEETNRPHPLYDKPGSSSLSPVVDAIHLAMMNMGVIVYTGGGEKMYEAILARSREPQPWRPGELEALKAEIERGIRFGHDSLALLTPVSDQDLAEFMAREGGNT